MGLFRKVRERLDAWIDWRIEVSRLRLGERAND
jgi:hypothetical protein